jgi:hypothetical protein
MKLRDTMKKAAVGGALVFGLAAPAAQAGENARIDGKYGYVTFQHHGEIIKAADIYKDGYGVRAILKWEGGSARVTSYGKLYPVPKNLSIPERTTVYLTLCYTQNKHSFNCSDPVEAEA